MKKIVILLMIMSFCAIGFGQTGFYRNLFGDYGANVNTTSKLNTINKLSNNGHFVTATQRVYADYFSCTKYDADFNPLFTAAYQASSGSTNYFQSGIELEDNRIVSIGLHNDLIFLAAHDEYGNLLFSKYYGTITGIPYNTGVVCKSSEEDTSFVALFAQCAVKHGLFKFDKNGNVLWSYEYSVNEPYYANVYSLDNGINSGYISGGSNQGPTADTTQRYGYLFVANNDGTLSKCKKFQHNSNNYNTILEHRLFTAKSDNYYVNFIYGNDYSGPLELEKHSIIAKLDSSLNTITQWKFSLQDTNQSIHFENISETENDMLLLSGYIKDLVNLPSQQYFILKFDPSTSGGNIIWSKAFSTLMNPQFYLSTLPLQGMYTYGSNDQILCAYSASLDGSCVSALDQNGDGHCQASDVQIIHSEVGDLNSFDFTHAPLHHSVQEFEISLTPYTPIHKDTIYCSEGDLSLDELENIDLVSVINANGIQKLRNRTSERISLEVYNLNGQLFISKSLEPHEEFNFTGEAMGVYLFLATQENKIQAGKIIL